jgi:hypothetical protein
MGGFAAELARAETRLRRKSELEARMAEIAAWDERLSQI